MQDAAQRRQKGISVIRFYYHPTPNPANKKEVDEESGRAVFPSNYPPAAA